MVVSFWYWLTWVVLDEGPQNHGCSGVVVLLVSVWLTGSRVNPYQTVSQKETSGIDEEDFSRPYDICSQMNSVKALNETGF